MYTICHPWKLNSVTSNDIMWRHAIGWGEGLLLCVTKLLSKSLLTPFNYNHVNAVENADFKCQSICTGFNSSPPGQNGGHFTGDVNQCIWMNFSLGFRSHCSVFLKVQFTKNSTGLNNGLAPNRRQAIIWTNADPIDWRMYVALGETS